MIAHVVLAGFELLHRLAASAVEMAEFVEGEAAEANPAVVEQETSAEGGDEEPKPLVSPMMNLEVHSRYACIISSSCSFHLHTGYMYLCVPHQPFHDVAILGARAKA